MWGDLAVLYAVSCMFDARITYLNGATMTENRIRHNLTLRYTDFALLKANDHYSAIGTFHEKSTDTGIRGGFQSRSSTDTGIRGVRETAAFVLLCCQFFSPSRHLV